MRIVTYHSQLQLAATGFVAPVRLGAVAFAAAAAAVAVVIVLVALILISINF